MTKTLEKGLTVVSQLLRATSMGRSCSPLSFAFVYAQMEGDVFTRAFIVILAAATSAVVWIARPQLLSFLLTAVLCIPYGQICFIPSEYELIVAEAQSNHYVGMRADSGCGVGIGAEIVGPPQEGCVF